MSKLKYDDKQPWQLFIVCIVFTKNKVSRILLQCPVKLNLFYYLISKSRLVGKLMLLENLIKQHKTAGTSDPPRHSTHITTSNALPSSAPSCRPRPALPFSLCAWPAPGSHQHPNTMLGMRFQTRSYFPSSQSHRENRDLEASTLLPESFPGVRTLDPPPSLKLGAFKMQR